MYPLIHRHSAKTVEHYLNHFPLVVVEGARQVGKSTLVEHLAQNVEGAVVVSLDDLDTRTAAHDNPSLFVNQGSTLLAIDEIQREPDLFLAIKSSIDRDRRPGRFLVTGSVDVLRAPDNPDSLAGRAATIRLRGLSQGELTGTLDDFMGFVSKLSNPYPHTSALTRADYAALIVQGGYPEVQDQPADIRKNWFRNYVSRILQKDAQIFTRGVQPDRLRSILNLLAGNQGGEFVRSRFANDLDIPDTSMRDSVTALENLFLTDRIPGWSENLTKREISRPKMVISDSGLASYLMGEKEDRLTRLTSPHFGPLLEGFVAAELMKQQAWTSEPFELYHFRDAARAEVDLVAVLESGDIIGIEVKASGDVRSEHAKGLRALRTALGQRWRRGVILHTGPRAIAMGEDIFALPVSTLWDHSPST